MCMCRGGWAADYATMMSLSDSSSPFSSASSPRSWRPRRRVSSPPVRGRERRRLQTHPSRCRPFRRRRPRARRRSAQRLRRDHRSGSGARRRSLWTPRRPRRSIRSVPAPPIRRVGRDGHLLSVFHLSDALFISTSSSVSPLTAACSSATCRSRSSTRLLIILTYAHAGRINLRQTCVSMPHGLRTVTEAHVSRR